MLKNREWAGEDMISFMYKAFFITARGSNRDYTGNSTVYH